MSRSRGEEGVYSVLYVMLVVTLAVVVGLVADIGALRQDRRVERLAADSAAVAGGLALAPLAGNPAAATACAEAWAYAKANLPGADLSVPAPCGSVPATCPATQGSYQAVSGPWTVTITWPIPNTSSLMTKPGVRPARDSLTQTVIPSGDVDGVDPCLRIGVTVSRKRDFAFASAGGFGSGQTSNTSVALSVPDGGGGQEVPLVVLDTAACNVITTGGNGAIVRVKNNGDTPGRIAIDSEASGGTGDADCTTGGRKVEAINGDGASILAYNGASGIEGVIWNHYKAFLYPGAPGLGRTADPADICKTGPTPPVPQSSSGICPQPIKRTKPVGRDFVDHAYHCLPLGYTDPVRNNPSEPCSAATPGGTPRPDHIGQLRSSHRDRVATSSADIAALQAAGYTVLPDPAWTKPQRDDWCADTDNTGLRRNQTFYSLPDAAKWYIDCATFEVNNLTQFPGGTSERAVVFRGSVEATAGCLLLNTTATDRTSADSLCATTSDITAAAPMLMYVQKGRVRRQNADLIALQVMLYQEQEGNRLSGISAVPPCNAGECVVDLGNGSGATVLWTAPRSGDFAKLALWSEGIESTSNPFRMGAKTNAGFIGTFFAPNAQVTFAGQPGYFASDAQFVAWRVTISGGALLELTPNPYLTNLVDSAGVRLIR